MRGTGSGSSTPGTDRGRGRLEDTELLALKFACESSYYYLFGSKEIHIYTDASGLEGMFTKTLDKHKNLRIRAMIEKLMIYNFVFHHVAGEDNTIVDCFSRLTREIKEAQLGKRLILMD